MFRQKFATHGTTAVAALLVGGLCGDGFASAAPGNAAGMPVPTVQSVTKVESQRPVAQSTAATASETTLTPTSSVTPAIHPVEGLATWKLTAGQALNASDTIVCESSTGRPVVLVQTLGEESVWYVQSPAESVEGTTLRCPVIIGNTGTPAGTPFQVALIVARNADDEKHFATGAVLNQLPAGRDVMGLVNVVRE
ncbi:MAG: hypothetical protein NTZ32_15475 [Planctomycetales bacterium]|nr:hypothetical protein [Planctomycetales bacterium]